MDQTLINIALTVSMAVGSLIMGGIGWFARMLWDKQQETSREMAELRVKMAGEYVSSNELANVMADIKALVGSMVNDVRQDISYIRNRVDGLPQRRQDDRT